jgi:hypothetical protein
MALRAAVQYSSVTTDRGVTTVPLPLRHGAAVQPKTELTWVPLEPELWLVGPKSRHPETAAPTLAAVLAARSPFQKLMRRIATGDIPQRSGTRQYSPVHVAELTEEQMVALGAPAESRRYHRGRE